jgi:hypothetical protein
VLCSSPSTDASPCSTGVGEGWFARIRAVKLVVYENRTMLWTAVFFVSFYNIPSFFNLKSVYHWSGVVEGAGSSCFTNIHEGCDF